MPEIMVRYDDLRRYCEKRHCGSVPLHHIKQMPTIEAEPVRHGRWVHHNGGYSDHFDCTACGEDIVLTGKWRFCPNCGAIMDATDTNVGHKGGAEETISPQIRYVNLDSDDMPKFFNDAE